MREEHPDWAIETEIISYDAESATMKAFVKNESGRILSTAHQTETKQGFPDYLAKAETAAIGRALALVSYGTQFAPDFDEGDRLADAPVEKKSQVSANIKTELVAGGTSNVTTVEKNFGQTLTPNCPICGKKMNKSKFKTGPEFYCVDRNNPEHKMRPDPNEDVPF